MNNDFNEKNITKMSNLLFVSSDETRLKILCSLLEKEKCVNDLVKETNCSQSLVSHQLQVLKKAKLVDFKRKGNFLIYFLDDKHVKDLIQIAFEHVTEK